MSDAEKPLSAELAKLAEEAWHEGGRESILAALRLAYAKGREEGLREFADAIHERIRIWNDAAYGLDWSAAATVLFEDAEARIRALKDAPQGETRREHKDHEGRK